MGVMLSPGAAAWQSGKGRRPHALPAPPPKKIQRHLLDALSKKKTALSTHPLATPQLPPLPPGAGLGPRRPGHRLLRRRPPPLGLVLRLLPHRRRGRVLPAGDAGDAGGGDGGVERRGDRGGARAAPAGAVRLGGRGGGGKGGGGREDGGDALVARWGGGRRLPSPRSPPLAPQAGGERGEREGGRQAPAPLGQRRFFFPSPPLVFPTSPFFAARPPPSTTGRPPPWTSRTTIPSPPGPP